MKNPITDLLSAPLDSGWTIERLAEQVISAIASQDPQVGQAPLEFVLDADTITDRQSQRLMRPLVACLGQRSAAEAGTPPNLYEGCLAFKRQIRGGPVWVVGEFKNTPGKVLVTLRRSNSPLLDQQSTARQVAVVPTTDDRLSDLPPTSAPGQYR